MLEREDISQPSGAGKVETGEVRHDWTRAEIRRIYELPIPLLVFRAQGVHREFHSPDRVQLCRLLSIKTGGCPEDCAYCPQSAYYPTGLARENVVKVEVAVEAAKRAKADGATRFCMGAAWREVPEGPEFDEVLEMVRRVRALDLEVCCTLGMLTAGQAARLKEAGLTAYNHNLDTSSEFYGQIISTRSYEERLATIARVRAAGITVCAGGILGMGERVEDRIGLLQELARLDPHPESVPVNALVRAEGTPLFYAEPLDPLGMVRTIATARILMPRSIVRLAAGREEMSREAVTLCFLAGANSIFTGEKLLTTPNPSMDQDLKLLRDLGMQAVEVD
jgi:biotin synthase